MKLVCFVLLLWPLWSAADPPPNGDTFYIGKVHVSESRSESTSRWDRIFPTRAKRLTEKRLREKLNLLLTENGLSPQTAVVSVDRFSTDGFQLASVPQDRLSFGEMDGVVLARRKTSLTPFRVNDWVVRVYAGPHEIVSLPGLTSGVFSIVSDGQTSALHTIESNERAFRHLTQRFTDIWGTPYPLDQVRVVLSAQYTSLVLPETIRMSLDARQTREFLGFSRYGGKLRACLHRLTLR